MAMFSRNQHPAAEVTKVEDRFPKRASIGPGPIFVTRRGSNVLLFHGSKRWNSPNIGEVFINYKQERRLVLGGEIFGCPLSAVLFHRDSGPGAFAVVHGSMLIGESDTARIVISKGKRGLPDDPGFSFLKAYSIEVTEAQQKWAVKLAGYRLLDQSWSSLITINTDSVISSPSADNTLLEVIYSFGGYIRRLWGDWVFSNNEFAKLPQAAIRASILCVALDNSTVGDLLLYSPAIG